MQLVMHSYVEEGPLWVTRWAAATSSRRSSASGHEPL